MPLYIYEWLEDHLRVDDRAKKSVVFIGAETEHGFTPHGTAALGIAIFEDMGNTVLITARHVIDDIPGEVIAARVNRHDGSARCLPVKKSLAITFRDKSIDLAILPISLDPTIYDFYTIPLETKNWEGLIDEHGEPETGDEVCVVGLYTTHFGHIRNIPIVRIGHIAAMPEEKVMTNVGYVNGYLIECHSIGGLSGSPVYWNVPQFRIVNGEPKYLASPIYVPLGILIGYHTIESKEDEIVVPQYQQSPGDRELSEFMNPSKREQQRTGFAVVLPINHIYDIFESDQMRNILKTGVEEARKRSGYRPASASSREIDPPGSDVNPNHLEDFPRVVDVAARPGARRKR